MGADGSKVVRALAWDVRELRSIPCRVPDSPRDAAQVAVPQFPICSMGITVLPCSLGGAGRINALRICDVLRHDHIST